MKEEFSKLLDSAGVYFREHRCTDFDIEVASPVDFARALGFDLSRLTTTLLLRSSDLLVKCLVVIPYGGQPNLRSVERRLGVDHLEVASNQEAERELGYPAIAMSPLSGGDIPVLIEETLLPPITILIGGGEIDVEIEVAPVGLYMVLDAIVMRLI